MLDGGKLCVKPQDHGTFLNTYFVHAVIKRERLCLVELKTPLFFLFFDIDALFPNGATRRAQATLRKLAVFVWKFVTTEFFDLQDAPSSSSSSAPVPRGRMLVSFSPPKRDPDNNREKYGAHFNLPFVVNAPIAQACRTKLLTRLEGFLEEEDTVSVDSTASSSAPSSQQPMLPINAWTDVIDDSVFKSNGLRMLYSHKGKTEGRPYHPSFWVDATGIESIKLSDDLAAIRETIKLSSLRCVNNETLTPCLGGEHLLAIDRPDHHAGGKLSGACTSLDLYSSVLPELISLLPPVYKNTTFVSAFVTSRTVMLKTNSRYCMNKQGEHRTSTVYMAISRQGVQQRCYCRKDERGCEHYASPVTPLPPHIVRVFFPGFVHDDADEEKKNIARTSAKKRAGGTMQASLKRCPLFVSKTKSR